MIVTRRGDNGDTIVNGKQVKKESCLVKSLGELDMLVSMLGFAKVVAGKYKHIIDDIQQTLFVIGSELGAHNIATTKITTDFVKKIEAIIESLEDDSIVKDFHIPGHNFASASLDVARAQCRTLEREMWDLYKNQNFDNKTAIVYINRLSDLLWIMARHVEKL